MELLCLWIPWSCGVPGLHVRSPVSGQVCVLPQSAIVTLLSLLGWGLLLALVRGHCLRLMLWASACVSPHGCPAFSRVGPAPSPWVPLLWTWLVGEASTVFLLLCLPSGCGHPLGSIVSFVTIDRQRGFHWRWFLLRCSLTFRSGVIVFLRPL